MRSPSQRWRASSFVRVPPRLVAFSIVRMPRSTRSAAAPSATSKETRKEIGIAHGLDRRVLGEPLGEQARGRLLALEAHLQRPEPALHEPGRVGGRDDAGEPPRRVQPVAQLGVARDGDAREDVVVAGEDLRRRVEDDVAAVLERPEAERRCDRRVADDGSGMGDHRLEVGHRQQGVRGRLHEDQVYAVGRRGRLVVLDDVDPQGARWSKRTRCP